MTLNTIESWHIFGKQRFPGSAEPTAFFFWARLLGIILVCKTHNISCIALCLHLWRVRMEKNFYFNLMNNQQWKSQNFYCTIWYYDRLLENTHSKLHVENIICLTLIFAGDLSQTFKREEAKNGKNKKTFPISKFSQRDKQKPQSALSVVVILKNIYLSTDPLGFPMENVHSESGTNRQLQL